MVIRDQTQLMPLRTLTQVQSDCRRKSESAITGIETHLSEWAEIEHRMPPVDNVCMRAFHLLDHPKEVTLCAYESRWTTEGSFLKEEL